MNNTKLTYFTPTYNRAHLLPQLYKSLIEQKDKNFIWMIIYMILWKILKCIIWINKKLIR